MGKPTASIDLEYPPAEWGKYWTPVHSSWTDEGKLERFWFGLDFEPHPAAKDEIFALLEKKWGEPKEVEEYGDKIFSTVDTLARSTLACRASPLHSTTVQLGRRAN